MGTTGLSLTLANSIIGVGILAMPFCFQQCGILLATLILILMGLVSRLCCYFLLKSALLARRRNFEFLAFQVFGSAGKLAVEVGIIGFLMGTCIAYFVVVGDLGPQIISKMFNINQSDILRTATMVIVSAVCVLPLGLLRHVDSLGNVAAATIGFYFCLVIKVICEAASQLLVGEWHTQLDMWKPSGVLQCVPIFSMALFCQTQLFEVFESMPTLSLEKMNVVAKNAINICTGVYLTLGVFGYIAFGAQTISGNILMSLSPTMTSDVIKLGFVMSVAFSFPLIIFPCRASLYSLLFKKVHSVHHDHIINHSIPETSFRAITVCIVGVALFISLMIPNIELVLGFVGSTIGVLICITFPAACFVNVTFKNTNERILAKGIVILGLVIMVLGTYANLQAADNIERYDDRYITKERIDKIVEDFFQTNDRHEASLLKPISPKNDLIKPMELAASQIEKDSEIQPPNPVPPESHSLEEKSATNLNKEINNGALKTMISNVNIQNNNVIENKVNPDLGNELPRIEDAIIKANAVSGNIHRADEDVKKVNEKLDAKAESNEIVMKQKQLIETIIQNNKEQRELMKEQNEILNEIKHEVASNEAKKIAVESIKQIANKAIESLNGVTDLPAVKVNSEKKDEPLQKLANEAVQQIAKKAVETIEAIKEQQEKIVEAPSVPLIQPVASANPSLLEKAKSKNKPVANNGLVAPSANVEQTAQVPSIHVPQPGIVPAKNEPQPANALPVQNSVPPINAPNNHNIPQQPDKLQEAVNQNVQRGNSAPRIVQNGNNAPNVPAHQLPSNANQKIQPEQQYLKADQAENQNIQSQVINKFSGSIPIANQLGNKAQSLQLHYQAVQAHSHSPDEPQSYKQGEDSQKANKENKTNNDLLKVPLPVAMIDNSQSFGQKAEAPVKSYALESNIERASNQKTSNNIAIANEPKDLLTHKISKREIDENCDVKKILNNEDNIKTKQGEQILPKVDLGDVALANKRPSDLTAVHHIRSLQSVTHADKKR